MALAATTADQGNAEEIRPSILRHTQEDYFNDFTRWIQANMHP